MQVCGSRVPPRVPGVLYYPQEQAALEFQAGNLPVELFALCQEDEDEGEAQRSRRIVMYIRTAMTDGPMRCCGAGISTAAMPPPQQGHEISSTGCRRGGTR